MHGVGQRWPRAFLFERPGGLTVHECRAKMGFDSPSALPGFY